MEDQLQQHCWYVAFDIVQPKFIVAFRELYFDLFRRLSMVRQLYNVSSACIRTIQDAGTDIFGDRQYSRSCLETPVRGRQEIVGDVSGGL